MVACYFVASLFLNTAPSPSFDQLLSTIWYEARAARPPSSVSPSPCRPPACTASNNNAQQCFPPLCGNLQRPGLTVESAPRTEGRVHHYETSPEPIPPTARPFCRASEIRWSLEPLARPVLLFCGRLWPRPIDRPYVIVRSTIGTCSSCVRLV